MLSHLTNIPNVIWSGVIGSVITLIGVWLSSRAHAKHLRQQLEHDAIQKSEDRKLDFRREAYLNYAQQIVISCNYLANISNADFDNINSGLSDYFVAAAKLSTVTDMETMLAINEVTNMYSEFILGVLPLLLDLNSQNGTLTSLEKHYQSTQNEIERVLKAQMAFNEQAQPKDFSIFRNLQESYKQLSTQSEKAVEELNDIRQRKLKDKLKIADFILPKIHSINEKQLKILAMLRTELGLQTDINSLLANAAKLREAQMINYAKSIQGIEDRIFKSI